MSRYPRPNRLEKLINPHTRLFLSVLGSVLVYWLLPLPRDYWDIRFIIAYVVGVAICLTLILLMMSISTGSATMRRSLSIEPSNAGVLITVSLFSIVSLMAIALLLNNSHQRPVIVSNIHMGLSLLAIFLSWLFVHTYFALHYARMYYREDPRSKGEKNEVQYIGGLEFPNAGLADYWDFLYYSFTIAMCYQTSDISVTSAPMRRITLVHSILSFIYVSCIFGLVVNLVSNLV
jgi:uncharacterized membrane protein